MHPKGSIRSFCAVLVFACVLLWTPSSASAQLGPPRINDCNEYLAKTMAQVEMSCYRPGQRPMPEGRWYPYLSRHQDWCPGAAPETRGFEVWAREVEQGNPETCRGFRQFATVFFGSTPGMCNRYAWRAIIQVRLAGMLSQFYPQCRFAGPRWDQNVEAHRGWCFSGPANSAMELEDRERRRAIALCSPARRFPITPPPTAAPAPASTEAPSPTELLRSIGPPEK